MRALMLVGLLALAGCNGAPSVDSGDNTGAGHNWRVTAYAGAEQIGQWVTDGDIRWADKGAPRCRFKDKATGTWVMVQGTCVVTKE